MGGNFWSFSGSTNATIVLADVKHILKQVVPPPVYRPTLAQRYRKRECVIVDGAFKDL